jgi:hypothetical protein
LFEKNRVLNASNYYWNASFDIYSESTAKYGGFTNFIRNILAPFAPALGMAFSRNAQVEQKSLVLAFVLLLLSLILNSGYLKHLALGLKLLHWQKSFHSKIFVLDA